MAIVYKHINPNTKETFYIGIGKSKKRAYSKHSRNKYWKNYTKKYGFEVEILKENISWNEACKLEIELIKKFGRKDLGKGKLLNMTDGGEGLVNISQVTRNKMSLSKIGKTPWNKGRKLKPYGKMCISTKNKISKSLKGNCNNSKQVLQFDLDGNFIKEYPYIKNAADYVGVDQSCIVRCCKGVTKSSKGFIWKYK